MVQRRTFLLASGAALLLPRCLADADSSHSPRVGGTEAPVVIGVSPTTGSSTGGTAVTVIGSGFCKASTVHFNGAAASDVSVTDDGLLTCITPAGSAGTASVTISGQYGHSSPKALFAYSSPEQIASIPFGSFKQLGDGQFSRNGDGSIGFRAGSSTILQSFYNFAVSDIYEFAIDAFSTIDAKYPANSIEFMIDSFSCHGNGASVAPSWWLLFVDNPSPARPYIFTAPIMAGPHFITIRLCTCRGPSEIRNGIHIERLRIAVTGVGLPDEPTPATRDPFHYPGSSYSVWNTSIGSQAIWSEESAPDTIQLNRLASTINAGSYSTNVYQGKSVDPIGRITYADLTENPIVSAATGRPSARVSLRLPLGMTPSPSGPDDSGIAVGTADNPRYFHTGFSAVVDKPNLVTIGHGKPIDCYNQNVIAADQYMIGIGIIRFRETVIDGVIAHMLQCGLSTDRIRPPDTTCTNLAWPNRQCDSDGPFGLFDGQIQYGATFGIPSTVDVLALGLSPGGLMLARAMQDYGLMHNISSPSEKNRIILYAEGALEATPQLLEMRASLPTLVPLLRIMRNQAPNSIQGGGTRRRPLRAGPLPDLPAIDFSAGS